MTIDIKFSKLSQRIKNSSYDITHDVSFEKDNRYSDNNLVKYKITNSRNVRSDIYIYIYLSIL